MKKLISLALAVALLLVTGAPVIMGSLSFGGLASVQINNPPPPVPPLPPPPSPPGPCPGESPPPCN
jgi:hypothetical protein